MFTNLVPTRHERRTSVVDTGRSGRSGQRRATRIVASIAVLSIALAACGSDQDSDAGGGDATATALPDGAFALDSISGTELVDGSTIDLLVEGDTISLGAGCNRMFGGYAIEDGRLIVEALASTKMACSDELMAQDDWLIAMLTAGPRIEVIADRITVADDTITLDFVPSDD